MTSLSRILSVWWQNRVANVALLFGRRAAAETAYRRILAVAPGDLFARMVLGNLLAERGDEAGAAEQFLSVVERDDRQADAWFNLGFLYEKRPDIEQAERCFRKAVALKPGLDRAWYGLGLVLITQGRLEEATTALKKNVKLQPFSPYGYYQLAMTWLNLGRSDEAWKVQRELERFEPKYARTLARDLEQARPAPSDAAAQQGGESQGAH
jgi:tetratricopeptide (TPR) repeat protein